MPIGSTSFVSNGQGNESLVLQIGGGGNRLVLHDAQTLEETGVAIETEDEFIWNFRVSPDGSHACVGIGLDARARLAVFDVDQGPPWRERWVAVG